MSKQADYAEELIQILLQASLTMLDFPLFRYRVLPISRRSEKNCGYDASVKLEMYIFFMQFKKPSQTSNSKLSTSKAVSDRVSAGCSVTPPYFQFKLHQDTKSKKHEQHNALFKLNNRQNRAAYVCPLFVDALAYQSSVELTMLEVYRSFLTSGVSPFLFHSKYIDMHRVNIGKLASITDVPVFRNHVSVPPLEEITDTNVHYFSFDKLGGDIWFHSPREVEGQLLSEWLQILYERFNQNSFSPEDEERFSEVAGFSGNSELGFRVPKEVTLETWQSFGDFLEVSHGIHQYGFVRPAG